MVEPMTCGMIWQRSRREGGDLVCQEPDGRRHGALHRDGETRWVGGHAGYIYVEYEAWWVG